MYTIVPLDNRLILVKLFAEEAVSPSNSEIFTRAYSLKHIEKVAEFDNGVLSFSEGLTESHSATIDSIADLYSLVKHYDKDFTPAPEIKHPELVLNENGTPKKFYHGSSNDFYIFDSSKIGSTSDPGAYGRGFYFTPEQAKADIYAGEGRSSREFYCSLY